MDMRILGGLGAAGLLALVVANGNSVMAEERTELIEQHDLSQPQQAFMDACASNMNRASLEFKMGADNIDGCACISGKLDVAGGLEPTQYYKMASETYAALLKSRKSVDQGMEMSRLSVDVAAANDVSISQVMTATMDILDSTKACGVRAETTREIDQRQRREDRCENTPEDVHKQIRKHTEKSGRIYDAETCTTRANPAS